MYIVKALLLPLILVSLTSCGHLKTCQEDGICSVSAAAQDSSVKDEVALFQRSLDLNQKKEEYTYASESEIPVGGPGAIEEEAEDEVVSTVALWLLAYPVTLLIFAVVMYVYFPTLMGSDKDEKDSAAPFEASSTPRPEDVLLSPSADATKTASLSFTGAFVQLCGIFQGVGLVNVPIVLALCGWSGLLIVGFVIVVKGFIGGLVVECLQAPLQERYGAVRDFAEIGKTAVGVTFVQVVRTINLLQLIAFASYFMVLIDVSSAPFLADFGLQSMQSHQVRLWVVLIVSLIVFPFTWSSETSLAWLAFLGNLCLMICPALLLASGLMLNQSAGTQDYTARAQLLDWATGFSIIFGADSGLQVMPHVYEVCAEKRKFFIAFALAVIMTGSVIFFTAYIGYFFYGNHLQACFTLNVGFDLEGNFMSDLSAASSVINIGLVLKVLLVLPLVLVQISDSLDVVSGYIAVKSGMCTFFHRFLTLAGIAAISLAFGTELIAQLATVGCTVTMLTNVCTPVLYYLVMFRSQGVTIKSATAGCLGLIALVFGVTILIIETSQNQNQTSQTHNDILRSTHSHSEFVFLPGHGMKGIWVPMSK